MRVVRKTCPYIPGMRAVAVRDGRGQSGRLAVLPDISVILTLALDEGGAAMILTMARANGDSLRLMRAQQAPSSRERGIPLSTERGG
jgi:hypothetical protein